ncbi:DUF1254 domain-containing protein [Polyangium sp. y55x31]|uniref:DUF1254 domain-containing protein n=1 Tax=Polyangium sp. y55x31 TaxID=3042688 RepID=UPI002482CCF1|nr:DUF1254 domain-containing protein [Polyangium sp. y55x31]MDI1483391.1 DUF1254 domain-containing protein [Polyangium sp. y55x31]
MKNVLISLCLVIGAGALPAAAAEPKAPMSEEEAFAIGVEAYVYGYPLVSMAITKDVLTNVASPTERGAPINQFSHARELLTAGFTSVVAPNNDTLYSQAWLDLSKEPVILHVPEAKGRYYLMPMLSGWTNVFASPGTRTTGTQAGNFAIVGPRFKGALPQGMKEIRSPTETVWIIGRTHTTGTPADLAAVHAFQDQLSLTPLSAYGKTHTPPRGAVDPNVDMTAPPVDQVNAMEAAVFFKALAAHMKENPPAAADAPMITKLARIGIVPGQDFDLHKLDPAVARGLERAPKAGLERIRAHEKNAGKSVNGWTITLKTGDYGTDYLQRAFIALVGLGANLPEDAVYPLTKVDGDGQPLDGANRYRLHFPKGQTPPVSGFWSLTLYNDQMFFHPNAIRRYAIHSDDVMKRNADGSLDLYIQNTPPDEDKASNWLPAPQGKFVLMLRMYWPAQAVLDGAWVPPAVQRVR